MTRRSSARLTPRTSVGKCGSIRAHCSSLSQNRFLLMNPSPNTNQYRIVEPERLMSSDPSPLRVTLVPQSYAADQMAIIADEVIVLDVGPFETGLERDRFGHGSS